MSTSDVQITFGADASALTDQMSEVREHLAAVNESVEQLTSQAASAGRSVHDTLAGAIKSVGGESTGAASSLGAIGDSAGRAGVAAEGAVAKLVQFTAFAKDLAAAALPENLSAAAAALIDLSARLASVNPLAAAFAGTVGATGVGLRELASQTKELSEAAKSLSLAGWTQQFKMTDAAAETLIESIERAGNVSTVETNRIAHAFINKLGANGGDFSESDYYASAADELAPKFAQENAKPQQLATDAKAAAGAPSAATGANSQIQSASPSPFQTQSQTTAQLQAAQAAEAQRTAAAKAAASQITQTNEQMNQTRASSDQRAAEQSLAVDMRAVSAQVAALRQGLRQKETVLSAEVAQHKITQQQKFAALESETQKEYAAELDLMQKERALDGLKAAQAQAVENKILALKQQNNLAMVRLDEQSIADQQRTWEGYFGVIESGFDSQLRGLLSGATKWGQAFKNILGDLIIKFIEFCEKMAFQWAATEIAQTTATTTGAAARAAANAGAATASSAATIASVLHSITASAAEAFAGIFGFLSPVMGPAAAGPAAAGQASVLAAAGGIGAFAQGSWELPSDMIAQVHRGEMIVPAAQTPWAQSLMASAGRAPGAGGDVHVHHATHFNISAMDSSDVRRWISNNGKTILKTINNSVRHGAHLGLDKLAGG